MSFLLRSSQRKHGLDARRSGGSRFFNDRGELNASDRKDSIRQLAAILAGVENGEIDLEASDRDLRPALTPERKKELLIAAFEDANRSNWGKMGLSMAAEVYQRAERQGFFRNLLRKVDVAVGERPEIEIVRNNVTALVMTTNAQLKPQILYEDEPTIILDTFEIRLHVKIAKKDLNRRGSVLMDRAEKECLEQTMVVEDRYFKKAVDEISGTELPLITISGSITPANIAYMRTRMVSAGAQPRTIVMAAQFINDFMLSQDFQNLYDPITKYEIIRTGNVANLMDLNIFTDAVRSEPNLRVLSNGDFYLLADPQEVGFYVEPGNGIDMQETDGAVIGESTKGWYGTEELGMIIFPNGVMRASKIG